MTGRLKCRHISHTHSYFIVRPLKLEEHSLVPYVAAFHDFMSDAETELFKSLAIESLERSAHGSKRPGREGVTSDKRTSKQYDILSCTGSVDGLKTKMIRLASGRGCRMAAITWLIKSLKGSATLSVYTANLPTSDRNIIKYLFVATFSFETLYFYLRDRWPITALVEDILHTLITVFCSQANPLNLNSCAAIASLHS